VPDFQSIITSLRNRTGSFIDRTGSTFRQYEALYKAQRSSRLIATHAAEVTKKLGKYDKERMNEVYSMTELQVQGVKSYFNSSYLYDAFKCIDGSKFVFIHLVDTGHNPLLFIEAPNLEIVVMPRNQNGLSVREEEYKKIQFNLG
jgi:DNA polymerase III sliding clamp (beta) subunit (PCNA family)